jgi:hypothetical protein
MEAVSSYETPVSLYQTTWHNNPEDSHIQIQNQSKILPLNVAQIELTGFMRKGPGYKTKLHIP